MVNFSILVEWPTQQILDLIFWIWVAVEEAGYVCPCIIRFKASVFYNLGCSASLRVHIADQCVVSDGDIHMNWAPIFKLGDFENGWIRQISELRFYPHPKRYMHLVQIWAFSINIKLQKRIMICQENVQLCIRADSPIPIDVSIILSSNKLWWVIFERHSIKYELGLPILNNHLISVWRINRYNVGTVHTCRLETRSASCC